VPAWLIWQYSVDVPFLDQWGIAHFFEKLAQGRLTLSDLYEQQNEFRQFFPHLIFIGLGWLTRWDVRYEMVVSLLLACLVAFNVQRLSAQTEPDDLRRSVLFLMACLFIFSTIQIDNWLFGVQVVYFMPVACVTTGLLLAYNKRTGTRTVLVACACLSVVSTFSSANGLLCWVVLPPVLYAVRPEARAAMHRWFPAWALGAAICAAAYAYGYHSPELHPSTSEALRHPFDAAVYFVSLLGGTFAIGRWPQALALTAGASALIAYVLTCAYLIKFRAASGLVRGAAGWVALGAYSLCTAAVITVGRLGFGVSQSLSTRYTTFTLYLMVALIYLLPYVLKDAASRGYLSAAHLPLLRRLAASTVVILLFAHVTVFALVVRHVASNWRRGLLKAKACLLFIESAPEERCLSEGLFPNVRLLRERAESLDRIGYLRPPLVRAGRLRDLAASEGCLAQYGSFALLSAGSDYLATGQAWLPHRSESADAVVLAYGRSEEEQTVFALAEVVDGVESGTSATRDDARWRKTFSAALVPAGSEVEMTAWALDAERGKAYRLCGTPAPR
jgi:hypothetical protein